MVAAQPCFTIIVTVDKHGCCATMLIIYSSLINMVDTQPCCIIILLINMVAAQPCFIYIYSSLFIDDGCIDMGAGEVDVEAGACCGD